MSLVSGLRVVVDVQHLYKTDRPNDRGAVYTLANGLKVTEASAALLYAQSLCQYLEAQGAAVLTNDPAHGIMVGFYSQRNRAAGAWGATAYIACHVNAGLGQYAAVEYMSTTVGSDLAGAIAPQLKAAFPTTLSAAKLVALSSGQRGASCIERVPSPCAAVLVEPFFGDTPRHQHLLEAPNLKRVGEAIGLGVMEWWKARRVVIV